MMKMTYVNMSTPSIKFAISNPVNKTWRDIIHYNSDEQEQ